MRLHMLVAAATLLVPTTVLGATAPAAGLQALGRALLGESQGVYVQSSDGTVLAAQNASRPVHPASVTKIATTLALLEALGPDHRFQTRFLATGVAEDGVLHGDLVVEGGGDPCFVSEHVLALLRHLRGQGIHRIAGTLRVKGSFLFNWKPDPYGQRLRAVFTGTSWEDPWSGPDGGPIPAELSALAMRIEDRPPEGPSATTVHRLLATHRSPPLLAIVKALNGYSNNVFHPLSEAVGGPQAVEAAIRDRLPPILRDEVHIDNAAGGGTTNRLSPRAAVAILAALESALASRGLKLTAVLPVSGVDPGTLRDRFNGPTERGLVVGKTGTFGQVGACALVGALRTRRYGHVLFAILNAGVPVPEARRRQDTFVRALVADAGGADPWPWNPPALTLVGGGQLE